jgi:hypothetical protein
MPPCSRPRAWAARLDRSAEHPRIFDRASDPWLRHNGCAELVDFSLRPARQAPWRGAPGGGRACGSRRGVDRLSAARTAFRGVAWTACRAALAGSQKGIRVHVHRGARAARHKIDPTFQLSICSDELTRCPRSARPMGKVGPNFLAASRQRRHHIFGTSRRLRRNAGKRLFVIILSALGRSR